MHIFCSSLQQAERPECACGVLGLSSSGDINEGFGNLFLVCWYLLFVVLDDELRQSL